MAKIKKMNKDDSEANDKIIIFHHEEYEEYEGLEEKANDKLFFLHALHGYTNRLPLH